MEPTQNEKPEGGKGFESGSNVGLVQEFFEFLRTNKLWWMTPIVLVMLVLAGIVFLGSTSAAPFIYTLF
jgi:hypothetical protein